MLIGYILSMLVCGILGGWLARLDGLNHTLGILIGVVFNVLGIVLLLVIRFAEILSAGFTVAAGHARASLKGRPA